MNAYEQMRDALVEAVGETCAGCSRDCDGCLNLKSGWMKKAKSALALPRRQCDVGTAEEQAKRYDEFTKRHWMLGKTPLQWAQMPYEAEEGAGK